MVKQIILLNFYRDEILDLHENTIECLQGSLPKRPPERPRTPKRQGNDQITTVERDLFPAVKRQ